MKLNKKKIVLCGVLCAGIAAGSIGHISAHAENMEDNQNPIHENQASGEIEPGIIIQIIDSQTKKAVKGTRFVVTDPANSKIIGYIRTDDNGYASIKLQNGTYILREVEAADGYKNSQLLLAFTVEESTKAHWHIFSVDKVSNDKQPEAEKEEISKEETQQPGIEDKGESVDKETSTQPEMDKVEDEVKDQEPSQDTDSSKVEESEKGDETASEEIKQPEAEKDTSEEITSKVEDEKHIETKEEGTEINKDSEPTKVEETVEQQEDVSKDVHVKQEVKKETQPVKEEQKKVRESVQTSDQTTTTTLWLVAGSSLLAMLYACKRKFRKIKK